MSGRAERLEVVAESVRTHCAVLEDEVLGMYVGAAVAQLALRNGLTPLEAFEDVKAAGAFDQEDWPKTRAKMEAYTRLNRQRYVGAAVHLFERDVTAN